MSLLPEDHELYDKYAVRVTRVQVNPEQWQVARRARWIEMVNGYYKVTGGTTILCADHSSRELAEEAAIACAPFVEVDGIFAWEKRDEWEVSATGS